jgi:hypothetical protein
MSSLTMRHGGAGAALEPFRFKSNRGLPRLACWRARPGTQKAGDERLRGLGLQDADIRAIRAGTFQGVRG